MSQVELNDGGDSPVLILGIDAGTTGTKIAFQRAYEVYEGDKLDFIVKSSDRIHMLMGYPGYRQAHVSTLPTPLIYSETGRLSKWGHEAINFQEKHIFDPNCLITNWKLKLLESSRHDPLEPIPQKFGKPPGGLVTDFFDAVTDYLFSDPRSSLLSHFGVSDLSQFRFIEAVISMPPGWSYEAHSLFRDAVKRALAKYPNVRVTTVSETECALRSWMSEEGRGLNMTGGDTVILLDLGGGTACLSDFFFDAATRNWVHIESYSLDAGSELVNANFECDFLERLKRSAVPPTTKILHKARQAFNLRKMEVGEDDEDEFWDCPVEGLRRHDKNGFQDGLMRFSSARLRRFFEPLQDEIFAKLDEITTRLSQAQRKPKYCVLTGAYSRNILFMKRFHAANDRRMHMQAFWPQNLAELVAMGACLTRVQGDCRLASGSRISVGIMTFKQWKDVKEKFPGAHHFRFKGEGPKLWCRVITWIIKTGDTVDHDKTIIDHDGILRRRRDIKSQDSLIFNDTICTSEAQPGKDPYTVLMYGTDDSGEKNKQDFRAKYGKPLHVHQVTLDLTDKPLFREDGSQVAMKNALFKRDHTDCRMSLEAFSAHCKSRRMLVQYSIPAFEVESSELQDEHRFAEKLWQSARVDVVPRKILQADSCVVVAGTSRVTNAERLRQHGLSDRLLSSSYPESDSRSHLYNVATAAMQLVSQERDRVSSEDQDAFIPNRVRGADLAHRDFGSLSQTISSRDTRTPSKTLPDLETPATGSETPEYQFHKRPTEKHHTRSLRDPVTNQSKSSTGIRKNKHRLARPSTLKMRLDSMRVMEDEFD